MNRIHRKAIAGHFRSRWLRGYVAAKLRTDPIYPAARAALEEGEHSILDLGCGVGLLSFYLRRTGITVPVTGIDTDAGKIATAARIASSSYEGLEFRVGDAVAESRAFEGSFVAADVLHYLPSIDRIRLLDQMASGTPRGGVVVIRECIRDGSLRYRATWLEERLAMAVGWLRVPRLDFPSREEILRPFQDAGFRASVVPLWGRTPFNNYLFVFRRQ